MAAEPELDTHCPANKAADILGDRWVLQIVRAMIFGATRYSDLQQAVPRISPTVLSTRLKQLVEDGIIVRREGAGPKAASYRLTPSGRELKPMLKFMAAWGLKWSGRNIKEDSVDIGALMWDVQKTLRFNELPDGENVIAITLPNARRWSKWWIVANGRAIDLCSDSPGKDVDIYVTCPIQTLIDIWQCQIAIRDAMASGDLVVDGSSDLVTTIDNWFPISPVALEISQDMQSAAARGNAATGAT